MAILDWKTRKSICHRFECSLLLALFPSFMRDGHLGFVRKLIEIFLPSDLEKISVIFLDFSCALHPINLIVITVELMS